MPATYVARETKDGALLMELYVEYEPTLDAHGEPAAFIVRVDDELAGWEGVEDELDARQREAVSEELGLPLLDVPRYFRDGEGRFRPVAYKRHGRRDWIGGKGYVYRRVVSVWNPAKGTLAEAGEAAAPGERFAVQMTESEFARRTYPPEDLPPMGREAARQLIERAAADRPGEALACRFVKHTDGSLRVMRFRYDPQTAASGRFKFEPKAKGLLPVFDVEKGARRFINLDGVRSVAGRSPVLAR